MNGDLITTHIVRLWRMQKCRKLDHDYQTASSVLENSMTDDAVCSFDRKYIYEVCHMTTEIELPLVGFSPEQITGVLLRVKSDLSDVDVNDLSEIIVRNLLDALREIDLDNIVKESLSEYSGMDREKFDATLSIDSEALFAEMLENGQNAEVLHG